MCFNVIQRVFVSFSNFFLSNPLLRVIWVHLFFSILLNMIYLTLLF